ncbi:MAG: hypothetical protein HIU84_14875 [Acidobacteria bacterium]|nr:hypothetical protein [Acidobacteriota bacterium]
MALVDKMKAQAAQLAQKAQEAGKAGQAKIEEVQAKRKADGVLRELGLAYYARQSGEVTDENTSQMEKLVRELKAYEEEHGPLAGTSDDDEAGDS